MPEAQAEAIADATPELVASDLATKGDVAALRTELKNDIAALEARLTVAIGTQSLRLTVRLGGLIAVGVAVLAALIKL